MTERLHFYFSLSCIGEGNGNPLQCSCLQNPKDGGAWWGAVHGVAQSRTRLNRLSSRSSSSSSWKALAGGSKGRESYSSLHLKPHANSSYPSISLPVALNQKNQMRESIVETAAWNRGSQPPGHGPISVDGLLGTESHSRLGLGLGPFPVWNQSVVPCPVLTVAS